jgi:hypothetical protein
MSRLPYHNGGIVTEIVTLYINAGKITEAAKSQHYVLREK